MKGEPYEPELMYVTLTFGVEDGEVVGYEFFPEVHSYAKTPEFWVSVAEFANDMVKMYHQKGTGPVEPEDGEITW